MQLLNISFSASRHNENERSIAGATDETKVLINKTGQVVGGFAGFCIGTSAADITIDRQNKKFIQPLRNALKGDNEAVIKTIRNDKCYFMLERAKRD